MEGKNIVIDWRSAEGKFDRLPALAAELVRLKVDIIVTGGGITTRAAKEVTDDDSNCHGAGRRSCWQWVRRQPSATWWKHHWTGNLCPRNKRKAVRASEGDRSQALPRGCPREFGPAGQRTNVKRGGTRRKSVRRELQYLDILGPKDIATAFRAASKGRADAVLTCGGPLATSERSQIATSR